MNACEWIPELVPYDGRIEWIEYERILYSLFRNDFILSFPMIFGKKVAIRKYPLELDKEKAFYHITCKDEDAVHDRVPDLRRCERIRWVRKFIENYGCNKPLCIDCNGMKVWDEFGKTHILLEEERYMVVLEKRDNYILLITAFYFHDDHRLRNALKRFRRYSVT